VATDASGNAWVTNWNGNTLTQITPAGSLSNDFGSFLSAPQGLAIDQSGDIWVDNSNGNYVNEFNNSGSEIFTLQPDSSLSTQGSYPAVDGLNGVWTANQKGNSLSEYNGGGTLSPTLGFQGTPVTIAATSYSGANLNSAYVARIDQSGNVWVGETAGIPIATNTKSYLTEFIGLAGPTIEPVAGATQQGLIGQLPGTSPGTTLLVTTGSLPNGVTGAKYNLQLLAKGGTGNGYTWIAYYNASALTSAGLTLSPSGLLSGTLTGTANGVQIGLQVTDSAGNLSAATRTLTVTTPTTLSITTTNLSTATVGVNYNQAFAATGGSGSYSWSIPNTAQQTALSNEGLNFSLAGYLNGTPTATNSGIPFTVKVTDLATGQTATAPYTLVANAPVLSQCTHDGSGNAVLNGNYAFLLTGFDSGGNVLDQIGSFQADGVGDITNGLGDSNNSANATAGEQSYTFSGTYSIGSADKRGQMVINASNNTNPVYFCFAADNITSGVAHSGRIIEATGDGSLQTGVFQMQNTADFTTAALNGGFAFGVQGTNAGTPLQRGGLVGQFNLNGSGGVTSGQVDIATYKSSSNSTDYTAAATLSSGGTYSLGSGGRGTLSISAGGGGATFIVYEFGNPLVSGFFMLSSANINSNTLLTGYAVQQMGASFTTSIAAGKGIFRKDGLDVSGSGGIGVDDAEIGEIGFDGSGNLSFIDDENDGGTLTPASGVATANYSVTPTGYLTITNAGSNAPHFYMYVPGGGFGLDPSNSVGLWVMTPQTGAGSYTASSLNGSYGTGTVGPVAYSSSGAGVSSGDPFPTVFDATVTFSSGTLSLVQDEVDSPGTVPYVATDQTGSEPYTLDPTYGANTGRFTLGTGVTGYIVSPTQAILMQTTSGKNPQVILADHQ
jgi:sugar lactone lactonase YvrE